MTATYQTARKTSSSSSASMVVFAIIIRIWNTMSKALSTSAATMTSKSHTKITSRQFFNCPPLPPPLAAAAELSGYSGKMSIVSRRKHGVNPHRPAVVSASATPTRGSVAFSLAIPEPRPPEPLSLTPPGANSTAGDTSYAGAGTTGANAQANANASATRSPTSPVPQPRAHRAPPRPALSRPPSDNAAPGYLSVNPTFHPPVYALTPLGLPAEHAGSALAGCITECDHARIDSLSALGVTTGSGKGDIHSVPLHGRTRCGDVRSPQIACPALRRAAGAAFRMRTGPRRRCFKQQCSIYKNGKRSPSETASGFGTSVTANSGRTDRLTWTESYPENVGAAVARLLERKLSTAVSEYPETTRIFLDAQNFDEQARETNDRPAEIEEPPFPTTMLKNRHVKLYGNIKKGGVSLCHNGPLSRIGLGFQHKSRFSSGSTHGVFTDVVVDAE
ncbi:hypothetical protein B0H11DRAFT_1933560 [Mycena galericulata]|nr:hypothetical protein B0H11DRAFT_1933560 [Mycena galericulata]